MIGLDTNVLVRYLVRDDPGQFRRSAALLETILTETNPGYVSVVALVETVWVLQRSYRYSAAEVARVLEMLLAIDVIVVAEEQAAFEAMLALEDGASFSDALIGQLGRNAGCRYTATFDRRASRLEDFETL